MPRPTELPQMPPVQAMLRGTMTALTLVVPAALLNAWLVSGGDGGPRLALAAVLWVIILLGGGSGGWATIRLSEDAPIAYAAAAPAIAYLVVQGVGVVRRLIVGETINWLGYPFLMLLMATCGMLGGIFARRSTRQV